MRAQGVTLVVGMRRTGLAVARCLAARGLAVRLADREPRVPWEAAELAARSGGSIELRPGEDGPELLAGVERVVPSPGVPAGARLLRTACERGIPVIAEVELAASLLRCPLAAVTGTNGKSTTTALIGAMLARSGRRAFVGGNLGTPLVEAVGGSYEVALAEVSSFQLEWVERLRPHAACLLNLDEDHLDRHPDFAAYRALKARLFAAQTESDVAVLNRDAPRVWSLRDRMRASVVSFGWRRPEGAGAYVAGGEIVLVRPDAEEEHFSLASLRLPGAHNVENAMAAIVVARCLDVPPGAIEEAIADFRPLPHRLELVREKDGVRYLDDSKATNVAAVVRSLEACPGQVVLLAGGVDKGGGYGPLRDPVRHKVKLLVLFGEAQARIARALDGLTAIERVASLEEAVSVAATAARPGDSVLLAPGCASFDMFADYAERGRAFRAAVAAL